MEKGAFPCRRGEERRTRSAARNAKHTRATVEPELVFELFTDQFGPMVLLDQVDQLLSLGALGKSDKPELAGFSLARRQL